MATYIKSLFRTGVPPATHLSKTAFLKVQFFNIEVLQIQMSRVSNCKAHWTKGQSVDSCDGRTFVNMSRVYQSRELYRQKDHFKKQNLIWICLLLWSDWVELNIFQ